MGGVLVPEQSATWGEPVEPARRTKRGVEWLGQRRAGFSVGSDPLPKLSCLEFRHFEFLWDLGFRISFSMPNHMSSFSAPEPIEHAFDPVDCLKNRENIELRLIRNSWDSHYLHLDFLVACEQVGLL